MALRRIGIRQKRWVGTAVNAHSAHTGGAVDAHSAHDTPNSMNPYFVVYIWKRTA